MATARPFAYNTGPGITGTSQVGNLAIGTPTVGFEATGLSWWNGPNEDPGYVIAQSVPGNTQPTPIPGVYASVGFFRSSDLTDASFLSLSDYIASRSGTGPFANATDAKTWLNANGYWTSYRDRLILNYDIQNSSSYPGSGTTIYDLSSNSNGAITGTVTYNRNIAKYIYLDNSFSPNYFTNVSDLNPYLNPPYTGSDISLFLWVYPTDNNGVILSEQGALPPNSGWYDSQIEMVSGSLRFRVWAGSALISSTPLTLFQWNYVGFTYDSATNTLTCYVNGVSTGTQSVVRLTPYNNGGGSSLYYDIAGYTATNLGSGAGGNFRFGAFQVYNGPLTGAEVLSNYNSSKINYPIGLIMDLDATNSGSYAGGSTWYDLTLNGNNGTITNAVYGATAGGVFNFNGTTAYVSVGQPLTSGSDYSISAWVYANDLNGARNIVSSNQSPFWCSNGVLYAGVASNYSLVSYSSLSINTWYFVSMTFNDSTNTMKLYVNGSLVDTNSSVSLSYVAQNTYVGSHYTSTNVSFWSGYISQVYMYKNEQSSADILRLYNLTKSTYENSFTINSSRVSYPGSFGAIFTSADSNGYVMTDNQNNQLWPTYYFTVVGDDTDIINSFTNAGIPTGNQGYIFNVTWGPGSTTSTLAKVSYNSTTKDMYIIAVDPTDTNWQTNNSILGTALVGTFNFPATFTPYYPITDKNGWC